MNQSSFSWVPKRDDGNHGGQLGDNGAHGDNLGGIRDIRGQWGHLGTFGHIGTMGHRGGSGDIWGQWGQYGKNGDIGALSHAPFSSSPAHSLVNTPPSQRPRHLRVTTPLLVAPPPHAQPRPLLIASPPLRSTTPPPPFFCATSGSRDGETGSGSLTATETEADRGGEVEPGGRCVGRSRRPCGAGLRSGWGFGPVWGGSEAGRGWDRALRGQLWGPCGAEGCVGRSGGFCGAEG